MELIGEACDERNDYNYYHKEANKVPTVAVHDFHIGTAR